MVVSRVGKLSQILKPSLHHHTCLPDSDSNNFAEASPNNRAGCQNKECKDAGVKILKGEYRYAIQVTIKDHQSWQYRHWYYFSSICD